MCQELVYILSGYFIGLFCGIVFAGLICLIEKRK